MDRYLIGRIGRCVGLNLQDRKSAGVLRHSVVRAPGSGTGVDNVGHELDAAEERQEARSETAGSYSGGKKKKPYLRFAIHHRHAALEARKRIAGADCSGADSEGQHCGGNKAHDDDLEPKDKRNTRRNFLKK